MAATFPRAPLLLVLCLTVYFSNWTTKGNLNLVNVRGRYARPFKPLCCVKGGYFIGRSAYYNNHTASFNLSKIVFVGIHPNPGPPRADDTLKTLYLNSRSIKALVDNTDASGTKATKIANLQYLVYSENYDIVCVCETWLNESILDTEIMPGYTTHRRDRKDDRRGVGILVCIKANLRSIRRRSLEGPNAEHVMVELFPSNSSKFMLGVFYWPPNSDTEPLLDLRASLDQLDETCQLLIVGDFNLPHIDWSLEFPYPAAHGGLGENIFCDIVANNFLNQMVNGPTHIRGNKLDYVLCNCPELIRNITSSHPATVLPTDHYPIEFDIKLFFHRAKPVKRTVYDFKHADFNSLRKHLPRVPLDLGISERSDINECWQIWKDLFLSTIDDSVPKKIVADKNTPPWINREVKHLIRKKYASLRKFRSNRTEQHLSLAFVAVMS